MVPGDAYVINDPYHGGTHLPDVTVITPVFDRDGREILFYVGSRGHHADIGGITPGSMPPFSAALDEEGVRFINFQLIEGQGVDRPGRFREAELMQLLTGGTLSGAQSGAEHRRPARADRRQREGPRGAAAHGRPVRTRRRAGLHAARAGQRRGVGAAGDHRADGRRSSSIGSTTAR